jgi:hypothetical protein
MKCIAAVARAAKAPFVIEPIDVPEPTEGDQLLWLRRDQRSGRGFAARQDDQGRTGDRHGLAAVIRAFRTFAPRRPGDEDQAKRLRVLAAELGARTVLVTSGEFGGMAANDGPVPVLAHAAQLIREAP